MRSPQSKPEQFLKLLESLEPEVAKRPRHRKIRRAAYAAGGLAFVTAASAGISSLRDRLDS
jgi:hypothetical protein